MAWVRFDPGFTRHKKRLKVGASTNWLWVCSVDYCVQHLTDGHLPKEALPGLVPSLRGPALKAAVDQLLTVGAWEKNGSDYTVHAFLDYQESADQVRRAREAGKQRARRSRERGGSNAERAANVQRTSRVTNANPVHDSAVLSSAVTPPMVPPRRGPHPTTLTPDGFSRAAFRQDCPDPDWHGRCVIPDAPGPKPRVVQCPHHAALAKTSASSWP